MSRFLQRPFSVAVLFLLAAVPYMIGATGCPMFQTPTGDQGTGNNPPPSDNTNPPNNNTPTNGVPKLIFTGPVANSIYTSGDSVAISFDGNDPENAFSYDLFYDIDGTLNGNEISITKGNSNGSSKVQALWATGSVPGGTYFIGAIIVDNAGHTDSAFVGPVTIQTGASITVTSPGQSLSVSVGDGVTVGFIGSDSSSASTIDVFYDNDDSYVNGVAGYIAQGLPQSATTATWNTTGVVPGTYHVGAAIVRESGTRVAAYAPGQVKVNAVDSQTGLSLAGLTIEMTQPAGNAVVPQGAILDLVFRGRDTANQATIDLFYDDDSNYDNGVTVFATGLLTSQTTYGWAVNIPVGTYRVGASIGRNAVDRLPVYASGRVLVNTTTGGGGGNELTVTFTAVAPAGYVKIGLKDSVPLPFTLSNSMAVGTVSFAYATDANSDHLPDGAWTTFTSVDIGSGVSSAVFNANGLAAGRYLVQGTFTKAPGTSYTNATRIADGTIEITALRSLSVTGPADAVTIPAYTPNATNITMLFQAFNPYPGDDLQIFIDWDRAPGGEFVFAGTFDPFGMYWATIRMSDTSLILPRFGAPPGLYFLGASLGTTSADRIYGYTPGALFAYDPASPAPFNQVPGVFTAIEPDLPDKLLAAGTTITAKWFVNLVNPGGSVRLYFEGITNGAPNGNRYNELTISDPRRCIADLSTTGLTAGQYFVGMTYDRPAPDAAITLYAPGKVRLVPANQPYLRLEEPLQNQVVQAGWSVQVTMESIDPTNGSPYIDVFFDRDRILNGNETMMRTRLGLRTLQDGPLWLNTGSLTPGIYFVGASIGETTLNRKAVYAAGAIYVRGPNEPTPGLLSVIAPVAPSISVNRGATVTVKWFVNSTSSGGTLDIFAEQQDANGNKLGPNFRTPAPVNPPLPPVPYDCLFGFDTSALSVATMYSIGVTYTPPGVGTTPITQYAPGTLFIRPASQYVWMGDTGTPSSPGVVMRGFNFNDFAGSTLAPVSDMDGDGIPDFVVVAQFGKPQLQTAQGTGRGEAYLIYGGAALSGVDVDLNRTGESLASGGLPGLIISGLQPANLTSGANFGGISSVLPIRDQDSDERPELVFGVPMCPDHWQGPLSAHNQFMRGGVVMVSSRTQRVSNRNWLDPATGSRNLELSAVGQVFDNMTPVDPNSQAVGSQTTSFWRCTQGGLSGTDCNSCGVGCIDISPTGGPVCPLSTAQNCKESVMDYNFGFDQQLVDFANNLSAVFPAVVWKNGGCSAFGCPAPTDPRFMPPNNPLDLWRVVDGNGRLVTPCGGSALTGPVPHLNNATPPVVDGVYLSGGVYRGDSNEPYGCRILGQNAGDMFGQSVSMVDDMLLVGAPDQTALARTWSGQVYELKIKAGNNGRDVQYGYKDPNNAVLKAVPTRPHQYIARGNATCNVGGGFNDTTRDFDMFGAGNNNHVGTTVCGTTDFNGDAKGDVLVGAPDAFPVSGGDDDSGAVYLVYRRSALVEGSYDLGDIHRSLTDRQRLNGVVIRGRPGERLGQALGPGSDLNGSGQPVQFDFNHDGLPDVVIGNQAYNNDRGEIVILFGNRQLLSRQNGFRIEGAADKQDDLLDHENVDAFGNRTPHPLCAVIRGENLGDKAGYNVSYAGDFDGDGKPDLLISAPDASPSLDINNDGANETLTGGGIVYLVFGSNDIGVDKNGNGVLDQSEVTFNLGDIRTGQLKGLIFAGRNPGDHLGGGEVVPNTAGGFGTTGMRAKAISWAGDVNSDGFDDILIGSPLASPGGKTQAGEVYLVFGFSQ